tara:strand:- start:1286 stop:2131 length:846 start_codon:yes stop_codon:yes gene_type:complete
VAESNIPKRQAMTIDVEDYFHVSAFEKQICPSSWSGQRLRVDKSTRRVLEIFDKFDISATFFILGWVAEACPQLVKEIAAHGHEIGCHSMNHRRATTQTPDEFRQDTEQCLKLLQDLTGDPVIGYRAPSFSIDDSNVWAFDVLQELGFKYSSSTYPVKHDLYGVPDWPRFKYQRPEGIWEIPIPTFYHWGRQIPIGGGGYFRLFPYWFSKWAISSFLSAEQQPYSFYFHPWEIDKAQPRVEGASFKSRFRHYTNISSMEHKLENLLRDFSWSSMSRVYAIK